MSLDNSLTEGKTYSCAGIFFSRVEALENDEQLVLVPRINADTVVPHREYTTVIILLSRNVYPWLFLASELDRVTDQVLEYLNELRLIRYDVRQIVVRHQRSGFAN